MLRGSHPELKRRVRAALDRVLEDPATGKELRGELAGFRSLRVGRIRVVYREAKNVLEVVAIGPRELIYEETLRLIKRETATTEGQESETTRRETRKP